MINRTLRGLIRKEFIQALRDPRMKLILFLMPVIQLLVFGTAVTTEIKHIRLFVDASPRDTRLIDIGNHAFASGWFDKASREEADVVLVPPPGGLTRAMGRGEGELQLLIDGTNVLRAQSAERYLKVIVAQSSETGPQLKIQPRVLYNPSMESSIFMVPGVMCMIVCVLAIILTSMSICKEKEQGTFEMMISAPVKRWEIIAGKMIPFFLLGLSNIPLILCAGILMFGVPVRGPLILLSMAAVVFVATVVSIGVLISTFARSQQQGMLGGFIFLFPAIMLSGVMFPLDNMPVVLQVVSYANPMRYFVTMMRNILLKGGDLQLALVDTGIVLVIGVIVFTLAVTRFRKTLG